MSRNAILFAAFGAPCWLALRLYTMIDAQYRRLNDEELGSAQRKLASSEQALKAARAGCDV